MEKNITWTSQVKGILIFQQHRLSTHLFVTLQSRSPFDRAVSQYDIMTSNREITNKGQTLLWWKKTCDSWTKCRQVSEPCCKNCKLSCLLLMKSLYTLLFYIKDTFSHITTLEFLKNRKFYFLGRIQRCQNEQAMQKFFEQSSLMQTDFFWLVEIIIQFNSICITTDIVSKQAYRKIEFRIKITEIKTKFIFKVQAVVKTMPLRRYKDKPNSKGIPSSGCTRKCD